MATVSRFMRRTVGFHPRFSDALISCGALAAVWWIVVDVVGSLRYPGYSYVDQTISELSAQGAPTRTFMLAFSGVPYTVLLIAFGAGVWGAAGGSRAGRITGAVLIIEAVWGFAGGIAFPMATRAVIAAHGDTLRNQMHVWYGLGMPVLFLLAIGFGSTLLGARFRYFSYVTILAMFGAGLLMSTQTSAMTANLPTPWMGVEERVTAYLPMLWFVVLAVGLLYADPPSAAKGPEAHDDGPPSSVTYSRYGSRLTSGTHGGHDHGGLTP